MFHVFGEVIPCWWHPMTGQYQLLTPLEERRFKLGALTKIMKDIARVSKINFFSLRDCPGRGWPVLHHRLSQHRMRYECQILLAVGRAG